MIRNYLEIFLFELAIRGYMVEPLQDKAIYKIFHPPIEPNSPFSAFFF
jgi:hypothetical protein